ncbi:MAG: HmuY family protein [Leadbetterella sp.]|nr:HmuY family protein [Leadbetterella sp.]
MKFNYLFLPVMLCLTACEDKEEEPKPVLEVKTVQIDARSYSEWVYFSFEKGEIVTVNPNSFSTDLNWDIAFHRNDVRLNGGASGKGAGGALKTSAKSLTEVGTAPASGYKTDGMKSIMTKFTLPVPVFEDQPASTEINWLNVDTSNPPPVYTLFDDVYVVKTAQGKYAKIKFKNYLGDKNETMIITLEYAYQPDGSTSL